jgi:hypothetical protein
VSAVVQQTLALVSRVEADDLPGAARELRRLEYELATELDRRNAPRAHVRTKEGK